MTINKNSIYVGSNERESLYDIFYLNDKKDKPVIIFSHGFKGFKDHGCFDLIAKYFAERGFVFIKFNFSHNGGTIDNPIDFPDLEAFSNNTYSKEIIDLNLIIDELFKGKLIDLQEVDFKNITLLGHSRGGGISIIQAYEDERISKLITLGSISSFDRFPKDEQIDSWKKEGVTYFENVRTHQQMPLKYQLYEDYIQNKERLDLQKACENLQKPFLIIHGDIDETVALDEAKLMHSWAKNTTLKIIENGNHGFGSVQPWAKDNLPKEFEMALGNMVEFLKK